MNFYFYVINGLFFFNVSVIPLGLIRDAHFTRNVPKYLNVGSLGLTLAHEILHSLDRMGRGFRADGRLQVTNYGESVFYTVPPQTVVSGFHT